MHTLAQTAPPSKKIRWAGCILSTLAILFLLFDSSGKLLKLAPVVEGTVQLGYPESAILGIGLVELVCLALYVIPRTSILGAVLLTGFLGGAVATHVRLDNPLFSHILFPVYIGALLWAGLFLLDARTRTLLPVRS
ncbi:DoxX family protein [candidate division KSB1 bacterium]|nr:DoxX family protein [candidate division KSB1 bacterium]